LDRCLTFDIREEDRHHLLSDLIGYTCIRFDTRPKQFEAQSLYRGLGFKEIDPYYTVSEDLRHWFLFMELRL